MGRGALCWGQRALCELDWVDNAGCWDRTLYIELSDACFVCRIGPYLVIDRSFVLKWWSDGNCSWEMPGGWIRLCCSWGRFHFTWTKGLPMSWACCSHARQHTDSACIEIKVSRPFVGEETVAWYEVNIVFSLVFSLKSNDVESWRIYNLTREDISRSISGRLDELSLSLSFLLL